MADALSTLGDDVGRPVTVSLDYRLVPILSEQMYHSPLKAIEELVVNAYDADAAECRVFVPAPGEAGRSFVVVYDDGIGMDLKGLQDLWHIGRSHKRDAEIERRAKRLQIGKFGIGKLATYAIADEVTYLSKKDGAILAVTLDFGKFFSAARTGMADYVAASDNGTDGAPPFPESDAGAGRVIDLTVRRIGDPLALAVDSCFRDACAAAGLDPHLLVVSPAPSWTFAILERLKPKATEIHPARLRWILSTAMPLRGLSDNPLWG